MALLAAPSRSSDSLAFDGRWCRELHAQVLVDNELADIRKRSPLNAWNFSPSFTRDPLACLPDDHHGRHGRVNSHPITGE